jgi:hypothetical protein
MRVEKRIDFLKGIIILSLLLFVSGLILAGNKVYAGGKEYLANKKVYYGKLLGKTQLSIGGRGKVLNGGTWDGYNFLGYAGLFKFPLNSFIDWNFWGTFLKADNKNLKIDYYIGKVGPVIHFLPSKIVDPYLDIGALFCKQENGQSDSGAGLSIELGTEILLGKYSALRVYSSYLKETLTDDDGWNGGFSINSCYKWICFYLSGEYTSPMKMWGNSKSIDIEMGLKARFSVVKFLKLIEEDLSYDVEERK